MKDKKNIIIICLIIVIIGLVVYLVVNKIYRENETTKAMKNIGETAKDYVEGIKNAESHLNEFPYNNETGQVEYHPKITLEAYNRIKEEMTKEEVVAILGKEDNIIKNDNSNSYIVEYGESYLTKGYWVQIIIDKETNKVLKKYQVGLE